MRLLLLMDELRSLAPIKLVNTVSISVLVIKVKYSELEIEFLKTLLTH